MLKEGKMRRPHAKGRQDGVHRPHAKGWQDGCMDPMLKEGKMVHGAASIKLGGYLPLRRALGVISSMSLLM